MRDSRNMVDQVEEYLVFRRSLGYALGTDVGHHGSVTKTLATQWAKLPEGAHPSYWARRLHAVRQFAKYAALYDETTEIPSADTFGPMKRRRVPHIYSQEQIIDLLQAASRLEPQDSLRPRTYVGVYRLENLRGSRTDVRNR
jgi:site-specific recombinase XerD